MSDKPGLIALSADTIPFPFAAYAANAQRRSVSRHGTPAAPYPRQLAFVHWLCLYLCELSLRDFEFVQFDASRVAAAVIRLALHLVVPPGTPDALLAIAVWNVSGYGPAELHHPVALLHALLREGPGTPRAAARPAHCSGRARPAEP